MQRNLDYLTVTLALSTLAGLLVGCATTGYRQAERSTASMQATRTMITEARREVAVAMSALNQIAGRSEGDLMSLVNEYAESLAALQSDRARIRSQIQTMRSRSEGYLDAWAEEAGALSSPAAREISAARQAETVRQYEALTAAMEASREAVEPLMANLEDIERMLKQDMTWAGAASVKALVKEASAQSREVQLRTGEVLKHLDQVAAALQPPTE